VAVIGFDDFEFAAYLEPPLTTVKLAGLKMGRKAAQMLLHYAAEDSFEEKEVTFPVTLVARASA
jgi:LacI family transcriptional regulator